LEGWNQQGTLLPGQEALRRDDMRDPAMHIDNQDQGREPEPFLPAGFRHLRLRSVQSYFYPNGAINEPRLKSDMEIIQELLTNLPEHELYGSLDDDIRARTILPFIEVLQNILRLRTALRDFSTRSYQPIQTYKTGIQNVKIALSAARLSIEWVCQQDSASREKMSEWPSQAKHLLNNICGIFRRPWEVPAGADQNDRMLRKTLATLLILKAYDHYGNRRPSKLAMFTIRELAMIVLDGFLVGPLKYQNWCIEPDTPKEEAWAELQAYLTGSHSQRSEESMTMRLENRGRLLYKAMSDMCIKLLVSIDTILRIKVPFDRCVARTTEKLLTFGNDLYRLQIQFGAFARSRVMRSKDGGIRRWKRQLEYARDRTEELSLIFSVQLTILRTMEEHPESERWKRTWHAFKLLERIDCDLGSDHYSTHRPLQDAKNHLKNMVFKGVSRLFSVIKAGIICR